ncbi:putative serine/threonine-protein kinase [Apostasia shenzhenica]|uniref:[RNA-polymerase]-subunit kinase n=1 Tax=Apostasia shenzhenica TaxID=1088818 RepID=A0A2I0AMX8_9ASPA|nr:putative serine/threonine-protein kinase [Apostasia shenzhenica]
MGCIFTKRAKSGATLSPAAGAGAGASPNTGRSSQRRSSPIAKPSSTEIAGWPAWLAAVAEDSLRGLPLLSAHYFEKIDKIGTGTYSNVFKAMDRQTEQLVALKKVRCEATDSESARFMAREIAVLRRVDHPNIVPLRGIITSRLSARSRSLYLVFDYMEHDLAGLAASPSVHFSLPQIKCYMKQLLSGLDHCHRRGIIHRDIKGSNLLVNNKGNLKIADFGLATIVDPNSKQPLTSRVVTLWYRAPELILGATDYGAGIDLWSVGCLLAELLAGRAILPGRTEVEQLHKIFKLCGSPPEKFWKKYKLSQSASFRPKQSYPRTMAETFKDFPPSALNLVEKLLAFDPADRGTAAEALDSEFFKTTPYACDPSTLPPYPPTKEMDAKLRNERERGLSYGGRRTRAVPAPQANAELQANLDRLRWMTGQQKATTKSEKFPPPHQDGGLGSVVDPWRKYGGGSAASFAAPEGSGNSSFFLETEMEAGKKAAGKAQGSGGGGGGGGRRRASKPSAIGPLVESRNLIRVHKRVKGELEVFGASGD